MAKEIIREDVIKVSYDVDAKQIDKAEKSVDELGKTTDKVDDKQIRKVSDSTQKLSKFADIATSAVGKLAKATAKGFGLAMSGAAAGVVALTKGSVSAYADYEQLVGGVETLFGAGGLNLEEYAASVGKSSDQVNDKYQSMMSAQSEVMANAEKAYETCGMSANDYMETVTGFSASLISGLNGDTEKAAKIADKALVDMADNANKMGTDIGLIQNAYQGFAKQNYTMLDNLKLGFGGTKTEMERLLTEAGKLTGKKYNINNFSDIIEAIHEIQDNMGVAGTTAKEAATTIQGSLGMFKAAWKNTLVALVRGGDNFDDCLVNLTESAKTLLFNVSPAIRGALEGIGAMINDLAPVIAENLPGLVDDLLPPLVSAAGTLVAGLVKALPNIIKALIGEIPHIVAEIGNSFAEAFGIKIPLLDKFGEAIANNSGIITKAIPAIVGLAAAMKLFSGISSKVKSAKGVFGKKGGGEDDGGILSPFQKLAKIKPTTVLKAVANIGIIVGGLTIMAAALMALVPHISKLSDFKSIMKLIVVIGALGVVGAAMTELAGIVGNIPVSTVALGLANIAIIVAGLSALYLLIGAVSLIDFDLNRILQITLIIGALGTVGAVLSIFAGIVGLIPIPVVLAGLANIALVLVGVTAIISAFALLSKIPGFDDFITKGGETLANLFNVIGKIGGSLIGGVGEGLSNSLPAIGENLSAFVAAIAPMLNVFSGVDVGAIGGFFAAIGAFMLQMAGNNIVSFFTGGIDFVGVGSQLSGFADSAATFFNMVATFPENSFNNASLLFQSLSDIGNIPCSGGIAQWFGGTIDFSALTNNLPQFGEAMAQFYRSIAEIDDFTKISSLFQSLAGLEDVFPKVGGLVQKITGEADIAGLGGQLSAFARNALQFFVIANTVDGANMNALMSALALCAPLAEINGSELGTLGTNLTTFMQNAQPFFTAAGEIVSQIDAVNAVAVALQTFFATVQGIVTTSLDNIAVTMDGIVVSLTTCTSSFDVLGGSITSAMNVAVVAVVASCTRIRATNAMMSTAIVTVITAGMARFTQAIKSGMKQAQNAAQSGANSIKTAVQSVNLYGAGVDIMDGLLRGMQSKKTAIASFAKTIANSVSGTVNTELDIGSPSKVMYKTGKWTVEGLRLGIKDNLARAEAAANQLADVYMAEPAIKSYIPITNDTISTVTNNTNNSNRTETNNISPTFNLTISGSNEDRAMERKVRNWLSEALDDWVEGEMRKAGQGAY